MTDPQTSQDSRLPTGSAGFDAITNGGLLTGGIYLFAGHPGAGKTILANQVAFAHAKRGGRVVYATLLSETHARLLAQIRKLSFFHEPAVGKEIFYLNGLGAVQSGGLEGLLKAIQRMVRDHDADLVVLDGMLQPGQMGVPDLDYKRFVAQLQEWIGVVGATVIIITTNTGKSVPVAEQTMVDGMFELDSEQSELRRHRTLAIVKYRGSAFSEGRHPYRITSDGLEVFPRFEAAMRTPNPFATADIGHIPSGVPGLDELLGGGIYGGSSTLLLGSSGSGKTTMGLQFVAAGAARGERSLFFGFFETPGWLLRKGDALGLKLTKLHEEGMLDILWSDTGEPMLDRTLHVITRRAFDTGVKRICIDGLAGLRTADYPERITSAVTVFANHLASAGITLVLTDETRELFVRDIADPTQHVTTLFHNILFLRSVELDAELRRLISVMKGRDAHNDRRLWEVVAGPDGVRLSAPFHREARSLMSGSATSDASSEQNVASEPKHGSS